MHFLCFGISWSKFLMISIHSKIKKKLEQILKFGNFDIHHSELHQSQMADCFTDPHVHTKVSRMSNKNAANPCRATAGSMDVLTDVCNHNNSTHN